MDINYLKNILEHDPETGIWIWLVSPSNNIKIGQQAGCIHKTKGYRQLQINKIKYKSANLVWFYMTGTFPSKEVDHKDTNNSNDKWNNLRLATRNQNLFNTNIRIDNTSGVKGISYSKHKNKYHAYINLNGKRKNLGYFDKLEEAKEIREKISKELHGEFARQ